MAGRRPPPQRFAALWGRSVTCQLLLTRGVTTWRTHECVHHSIINERWVESRTGASADAEAPPRFPSPSRPGEFHPEPLTEPERIRTSHNPPDDVAHAPTRAVPRLGSTLRRAATQRSEPERRQEWRRGTQSACATSSPKKSGCQTGRRPFRGVESTACREGDPGRWGSSGLAGCRGPVPQMELGPFRCLLVVEWRAPAPGFFPARSAFPVSQAGRRPHLHFPGRQGCSPTFLGLLSRGSALTGFRARTLASYQVQPTTSLGGSFPHWRSAPLGRTEKCGLTLD